MKPIKTFCLQLLASLAIALACSSAQAQEVQFDCQKSANPLAAGSFIDLCKASNVDVPVVELSKLATSVFDFLDTPYELPMDMGSNCYTDTLTGLTQCSLGSGAQVDQSALYFNCVIDPGNTANFYTPSANCTLYNANNPNNTSFEQAMTMVCSKVPMDSTSGSCQFNLNKQPILDAMQSANNFNDMNPNERAIHDAFWTCLNRVGLSTDNQSQCDKILMDLMNDTTVASEIVEMLREVTPNHSDISLDVSGMNILHTLNSIVSRLSQLRNGFASNSVNIQYFDGQQWLDRNTLLAANNISMNDVSPEKPTRNMSEYGRLGLFLNGSAIKSDQTASLLEQRHEADTQIATLGMDYRFTDNFVAGIAMNLSQSNAAYGRNAGKLDNTSTALAVYSSYYIDNWYLDANINYGQDDYEQERNVYCKPTPVICPSGFYQSFTSDFSGSQTLASIATGYQWQKDALGITPFIQLNRASIKTDSYSETPSSTGIGSGDKYALSIGEQKRDTSTIKLGTNLQYTFATNNGVIMPLIGIYGIRELENNANMVTGHFIGNIATDGKFNLATNDVDTSYFIIAGGLNFQLKNGNAGFINIQSTEGYDNLSQIQYTAGWRWEL